MVFLYFIFVFSVVSGLIFALEEKEEKNEWTFLIEVKPVQLYHQEGERREKKGSQGREWGDYYIDRKNIL